MEKSQTMYGQHLFSDNKQQSVHNNTINTELGERTKDLGTLWKWNIDWTTR